MKTRLDFSIEKNQKRKIFSIDGEKHRGTSGDPFCTPIWSTKSTNQEKHIFILLPVPVFYQKSQLQRWWFDPFLLIRLSPQLAHVLLLRYRTRSNRCSHLLRQMWDRCHICHRFRTLLSQYQYWRGGIGHRSSTHTWYHSTGCLRHLSLRRSTRRSSTTHRRDPQYHLH